MQVSKNQEQIASVELARTKQAASVELAQAKKESQDKVDGLTNRLLSIERHVGDKSIWDLSAIVITSSQAQTLSNEYHYYNDIHCYLAVPKSSLWTFVVTDEWQFMKLMYGDALNPENVIDDAQLTLENAGSCTCQRGV